MNAKELERTLKALANRRRLLILQFLKRSREASVGNIAEEIKLSFRATSRHLSVLLGAGIIDREQKSVAAFYSLASDMPQSAKRILNLI